MKLAAVVVVALLVGIVAGWVGHGFWNSGTTDHEVQKTFDGVSRANKAVDSAVTVGVAYQKFADLVQNFATEISVAKDKVKSQQETEIFQAFTDVLGIYSDTLRIWSAQISRADMQQYLAREDLGKILIDQNLVDLAKKYELPVHQVKYRFSGITNPALPANSLSVLLAKAHTRTEEANKLPFGKPDAPN